MKKLLFISTLSLLVALQTSCSTMFGSEITSKVPYSSITVKNKIAVGKPSFFTVSTEIEPGEYYPSREFPNKFLYRTKEGGGITFLDSGLRMHGAAGLFVSKEDSKAISVARRKGEMWTNLPTLINQKQLQESVILK